MEFIKLNYNHLVKENTVCNGKDRFSHPAFTRKIDKSIMPCDFDKSEKKIEVEFIENGDRRWFELDAFFW